MSILFRRNLSGFPYKRRHKERVDFKLKTSKCASMLMLIHVKRIDSKSIEVKKGIKHCIEIHIRFEFSEFSEGNFHWGILKNVFAFSSIFYNRAHSHVDHV